MASVEAFKSTLWAHLEAHMSSASSHTLFGVPLSDMTPANQQRALQAFREVVRAVNLKIEKPTTADDRWYRKHYRTGHSGRAPKP
jgi:hypothetical protein